MHHPVLCFISVWCAGAPSCLESTLDSMRYSHSNSVHSVAKSRSDHPPNPYSDSFGLCSRRITALETARSMNWTPDGQGRYGLTLRVLTWQYVHETNDSRQTNRWVAKETYAWPEPLGSAGAPHFDPWADLESWKACHGLDFQWLGADYCISNRWILSLSLCIDILEVYISTLKQTIMNMT